MKFNVFGNTFLKHGTLDAESVCGICRHVSSPVRFILCTQHRIYCPLHDSVVAALDAMNRHRSVHEMEGISSRTIAKVAQKTLNAANAVLRAARIDAYIKLLGAR